MFKRLKSFEKLCTFSPKKNADKRAKWLPFLNKSQYQGDWVSGGTRFTINPTDLTKFTPASPWFVYDSNGNFVFSGERTSASDTYNFRSELRHGTEWNPAGVNFLEFEVELGSTTLREYTFGQIHRKEIFATQPPARLVWISSRSSVLNNLYVVLRRDNGTYQYFALGTKPEGKFKARLDLNDLELTVKINDVVRYQGVQSDWVGYNCYFKIGTYLTGSIAATGSITAKYSSLSTASSIINKIGFD